MSDEELPETVTFSESRQRFQNILREEKESKTVQSKHFFIDKQPCAAQGTSLKFVSEKIEDDSTLHVPETEIFRQAASATRFDRVKTEFLPSKKSVKKKSQKSKKRVGNVQLVWLAENSQLARKKSANDNPEKFLKDHFYGSRLLRSFKKDANLTRSKHLYRPSPFFRG